MRVKLIIAYDGTNYHGWQKQPNAKTIEECIEDALKELFKEDIDIIGASRTDAGVHALGNVAAFDVETRMDAERIALALNQKLPQDIRIMSSEEVEEDFNPRFDAYEKTYEYRISNRRIQVPTKRLYTYFYHKKLNTDKMRQASSYLVGEHDFTSFASIHSQTDSFVRTIYECKVIDESDTDVVIRIRGNGFLYNMVRIIAGTLIKVGIGEIPPERMKEILYGCDRSLAGPTAPPTGLTLCEIEY